MNEVWRDVPGYEGIYQASNLGRIRSLKTKAKKVLKQNCNARGYYVVNLFDKEGKLSHVQVHRIIALTWIPNPDNKPTVDHIDRNKENNNVENLRWATSAEQNAYQTNTTWSRSVDTKFKVKCIETGDIFDNSAAAAHWVIDNDLTNSKTVGYVAERIRFCAREDMPKNKSAFGLVWKFVQEGQV